MNLNKKYMKMIEADDLSSGVKIHPYSMRKERQFKIKAMGLQHSRQQLNKSKQLQDAAS